MEHSINNHKINLHIIHFIDIQKTNTQHIIKLTLYIIDQNKIVIN